MLEKWRLIMVVTKSFFLSFLCLGLSKELYYVTEGVPNTYALNFVVLVPATVNALHFTWKTLGQKPVRTNLCSCFFLQSQLYYIFMLLTFKKVKYMELVFRFWASLFCFSLIKSESCICFNHKSTTRNECSFVVLFLWNEIRKMTREQLNHHRFCQK